MRDHSMVQAADRIAAAGQAKPWEESVHEAGEAAHQHPPAEAERHAHVLQIGLVDRGRMVEEAPKHAASVCAPAENGLLPLRKLRQFRETHSKKV